MNKLFTKIAALALGVTMAVGVGVAVASSNKEAAPVHAAVPSGNELLFTINFKDNGTDSSTALSAANFYSSGVTSVTDKNGSTVTSTFSTAGISGTPSKVYPGNGGLKCGSNKNAASFTLNIPSAYQAKFTYAVINCTNATRSITLTAGGGSDTLASGNSSFGNHDLSISSTSTATTLAVSIASASKTAAYIASIAVYKAAAASKTLSSIAVTTAPSTTTYYVGQSFSSTGMVVTATYSDASTANVTSSCTFTPDSFTTTGSQNVTVSYTEGGVTKTATQAVTVNARTVQSVSSSGQTTSFDAGAKFSYGGTLTASYNYGSSASVSPTSFKIGASGITPTSAGDAITTNTTLTVADHNGKTVYVLYTENGTTVWTSYTITVNALPDVVLSASNNPYPSSATSKANATEGPSQVTLSGIEYQSSYGYVYNNTQLSLHPEHNSYLGNNTAFSKNIKKIVIAFNDTNSAGRGTMYEGASALAETSSISASMSLDNKTATYTFSDANPYFKFKQTTTGSSNYINILSISIYLGSAVAQNTTTALSVTPNSWSGYDSEELDVSDFTVSCTTSATSGEGYVFQGIGYMSGETFVARDASFSSGNPTTSDTRLCWKGKYPTTAGGSTYLYAYVTLSVTHDAVSSIEITGSMTNTTYDQGDPWDPTGFTVNAYYLSAPSTPVDVTSEEGLTWTYSPATTASTSTKKVTCTATFEGQSDTSDEQSVTINEKSYIGGIVNGGKYVIVADSGYILPSAAEITSEPKNVASYTSSMKNDEDYCWTFTTTGVDNHWTITNSLGTSLKHAATSDGVRTSTVSDTSDDFEASLTNDNVTIGGKSYTGIYLVANSRYLTQYTANVSWRCYGNANTNGTSKLALIPYETPDVLDSDLTLTGKPASLTAGSLFPGVTKAEAEYSETGPVDVTEDVTYTLGGTAIAVGDTVPAAKVGASVTVVVTYTDANDDSATASFSIPVNYKPVTSVTLDKASATITKGGTVQLTASVSDEYAIKTVKWTTSNSSIATVSAATSTSGNAITVTGSYTNAGSATITAYVDENDNGSIDSGEKSATCTVTVSGDPVLNMLDGGENVISGELFHAFTTDSNIILHVDAQNFVGAITYTWSSSNTNAIAIAEEADEVCEFDIVGAGTNVRLSCHAVGATSGNLTTYVDYTVTEPQVDEVTWSAPATLSVYDNASLTAANITSWSPAYHKDNGESGSISSGYTVKLGGTTISLSHPWDVEDDGEELWIEYGGIASSHVTVQVTEHLNAINYQVWSKVTDDSDLEAGDEIVIGEDTKGKFMTGDSGSMSSGNLATVAGTVTDGVVADMPSGAVRLTLGGSSGAWTLQNSAGEYLSITTTNSRHLQFVESSVTLGISIDDSGNATISSSSGTTVRILLNNSANPARFSTYNSSVSDSMLLPEIYKNSSSNIADTNATAQRALLSYVATFNSTMSCDEGGDTANIASKWSSASSAFTTAMNALGTDDKTVFKRLVANASAVEDGDSLQDMLARYDYIIAKYDLSDDFLHDSADRAAVALSPKVSPLVNIIGENTNTVAIIVIISMVSVTAIGGYFFLRKKKEQ